VTRSEYLRTLLQSYVEAPDTPDQPRRHDRAIAVELYRSGVPLEHLLHAIRLATLRRHLTGPHPPVHSLAYYRAVLLALTNEELQPLYVGYLKRRHQQLAARTTFQEPRLHNRNPALPGRR